MKAKNINSLKNSKPKVGFLRTGSTLLNMALSCHRSRFGGIPTRRITEMSGTASSGKTYVLSELCGNALRDDYNCVVVDDVERRWDLERLSIFGINLNDKRFHYLKESSKTLEVCFETMFRRMDKLKLGKRMLYVVDPIAALYSETETDPMKDMGKRAKVIQYYMRRLRDRVGSDKDITVVLANQLIDNVGIMFGPKQITPGGNALLHWPSVKIRFMKPKPLFENRTLDNKTKKRVVGVSLSASIQKNSEDDPFRTALFTIRYGYGIDDVYDCITWLKEYTSVLGSGKSYDFKNKSIIGITKFISFIEEKKLERKLFRLTRKYYRKWYAPSKRRKKILN